MNPNSTTETHLTTKNCILFLPSSFRYHRILKKEKQKALNNVDLEKLSKDDPEMFEKHLEKAEKMRAMVCMNFFFQPPGIFQNIIPWDADHLFSSFVNHSH